MSKLKTVKERPDGCGDCQLVLLILGAMVGELMLFFQFFPYPTGRLLILILLQPLVVNLLLMGSPVNCPLPRPENPRPEKPEKKGKFRYFLHLLTWRIRPVQWRICNFLSQHRLPSAAVLSAFTLLWCNLWFWKRWKPFFQHPVSVYIPLVLAVGFFLLLGLDIWCGHLLKGLKEPDGRMGCILGNLRNQIAFDKFLFLAAAAIAVMPMVKLPRIYRQYYYFLCGWYVFQTVMQVIFFGIRAAKRELRDHPDFRPLVLHRKKGDLSLLAYLEENTGITMRSLWSISLVKKLIPYAILASVLLLWLCTGIVQIAPSQHGALYRLGRLAEDSLDPGLHLVLPWPFDSVDVYNTESLKEITIGYTTDQEKGDNLWTETHGGEENKLLLGGGNELVSINLRIEFKIENLTDYLKCSNSPESLLESAAYEAVTARTISSNLESLLALDRFAFSESFEKELSERIARYDTGLRVVDVVLESIHPPVEVAEIYQQIISAGIEAQKRILDAQGDAAQVLEDAEIQRDSRVNEAKALSYGNIAAAKSSVAEFMAGVDAYAHYGDNYRYYKYLDALEKAYSGSTLVLVGEGVDSSHLYLGKIPS